MARSHGSAILLFWLMFVVGGTSLFACLILPAWLEVRALRQAHAVAGRRIAELEEHLTRVAKQIEHLQHDQAYLERLARQEFGIQTPGVEMVWIDTSKDAATRPTTAPAVTDNQRREEELATAIEQAARTSPLVSVFVLDQTRPIVMAMSGVLMLVALVLLVRGKP